VLVDLLLDADGGGAAGDQREGGDEPESGMISHHAVQTDPITMRRSTARTFSRLPRRF
jgi:hypothetical protein